MKFCKVEEVADWIGFGISPTPPSPCGIVSLLCVDEKELRCRTGGGCVVRRSQIAGACGCMGWGFEPWEAA